MSNNLIIWSNELTDKIQLYINGLPKKQSIGLLKLIQNTEIEFDVNQSSRMLNYYEEKGYIKAFRIGKGKRRFSMSDALGFSFSLYLNKKGSTDDEIVIFNKIINSNDDSDISIFDTAVLISSISIGLEDLFIYKSSEDRHEQGLNTNQLAIRNREEKEYFAISSEIRLMFNDPESKVFQNDNLYSFLPQLLFEIDKIRKEIGLPLLNESHFESVNKIGMKKVIKDFDLNKINVIHELPFNTLRKQFKFFYKDGSNDLFGLEIKRIGSRDYIPNGYESKITDSIEDMNDRIKNIIQKSD